MIDQQDFKDFDYNVYIEILQSHESVQGLHEKFIDKLKNSLIQANHSQV